MIRYAHIGFEGAVKVWPELSSVPDNVRQQISYDALYSGYLDRQSDDISSLKREEEMKIPDDLDYDTLPSLSNELRIKLKTHRPDSIGAASRIQGMTPAAVMNLIAQIKKRKSQGLKKSA